MNDADLRATKARLRAEAKIERDTVRAYEDGRTAAGFPRVCPRKKAHA